MVNRRVEFRVNNRGEVRTDFIGFAGPECYEEADRLRRLLATLGVTVEDREVVPKTEAQMALETGADLDEEAERTKKAKSKAGPER